MNQIAPRIKVANDIRLIQLGKVRMGLGSLFEWIGFFITFHVVYWMAPSVKFPRACLHSLFRSLDRQWNSVAVAAAPLSCTVFCQGDGNGLVHVL